MLIDTNITKGKLFCTVECQLINAEGMTGAIINPGKSSKDAKSRSTIFTRKDIYIGSKCLLITKRKH